MIEDAPHKRLIELPKSIWAALDDDAKACRRSALKQLEAILTVYYRLGNVELRDLSKTRDLVSPDLADPHGTRSIRKVK